MQFEAWFKEVNKIVQVAVTEDWLAWHRDGLSPQQAAQKYKEQNA
jgi:hypothetical protein